MNLQGLDHQHTRSKNERKAQRRTKRRPSGRLQTQWRSVPRLKRRQPNGQLKSRLPSA